MDMVNEEIREHMNDPKWKAEYTAEYQTQKKKYMGIQAMGGGDFSTDFIKKATLMQMKTNGVFQNAINKMERPATKANPVETISNLFCVPNCTK
jgi:predicted metal-dependent phosphotriesterase family hydrolase